MSLAWASPSGKNINSADEWIFLLGYDSESDFSEDDLDHLQRLFNEPLSDKSALKLMEDISILPLSDVVIIKDATLVSDVKNSQKISPSLKILIQNITIIKTPVFHSTIQERITFKNSTRHDWRGTISVEGYEIGLLMEKDPEEKYIADHATLYLKGNSSCLNWIAGSHQLAGGYGLVSWKSSPPYKGFETVNTLPRKGKGINHFRSSNEYWSTFGLGAEWANPYGKFSASVGRNDLDGTVNNGEINIDITGIHVTAGDLSAKNQLTENTGTFMWENSYGGMNVGAIIHHQTIQHRSGFSSLSNVASLFTSGKIIDWKWFGEHAISTGGNLAILGGVQYSSNKMKYLISFRSYSSEFQSSRGQRFGEWHSSAYGEKGVFQNFRLNVNGHIITVLSDIAEKLDENNQTPQNVSGQETGLRWQWKYAKHQFRVQWKQDNKSDDEITYLSENSNRNTQRTSTKWKYQYSLNKRWSARWQFHTAKNNTNEDLGFGLETRLNLKRKKSVVALSWIMANVKSFDSRLYFWDINLPGEMRSVMVSERSHQLGFRIKYIRNESFRLFFRLRTVWANLELKGNPKFSGGVSLQINI